MRGHVEQGLSVPVKAMIDQSTANRGPSMLELSSKINRATLAHLQVDKDTGESQQKSKQLITYGISLVKHSVESFAFRMTCYAARAY